MNHDASQSRYLRKKYANDGYDEEEEEQEKQFGQNLEKALDVYGKKGKKKDIESQVEYFGNMIEPFNMKEEQEMGDIDHDGYFVFKRRGEYRDAWLDSIEQGNDLMVADKVNKKIKTEGITYKGVYDEDADKADDDQRINEADQQQSNQDDEKQQEQNLKQQPQQQQDEQQQEKLTLQPNQIKQLICELLPMNKSANAYVKQLKKKLKDPETKQLHDKILQLCNMYIQKTNEYDILTSKKQQLEVEVGEQDEDSEKSEEINWDEDEDEVEQKNNHRKPNAQTMKMTRNPRVSQPTVNRANKSQEQKQKQKANNQDNYSDDDIF